MDFFSRLPKDPDDNEPTDLSGIHADDALIESLRSAPLFADFNSHDDLEFGVDSDLPGWWESEVASNPAPTAASPDTAAGNAPLADLLHAWRQELASVPLPEPMDSQAAAAIIRAAPVHRRSLRPMLAVAVAIVGLLIGSAAIGARSATPGSLLWPVTKLLWSDRANSLEAGKDARDGIDQANKALDAGHPEAAVVALQHVTVVLTRVEERDGRKTLESDYQQAKASLAVATADGHSTAGSILQSSTTTAAPLTTLNPLPPVVPGTTPAVESSAGSTTSEGPPSSDPSPPDTSTTPSTSDPVTTPTTSEPTAPSTPGSPTETPPATSPTDVSTAAVQEVPLVPVLSAANATP